MADVKVNVQVNSNLAETTKEAVKLAEVLRKADIAAGKIRIPNAVAAAQQGVAASNNMKSGQGETKTARSIGAGAGTGSATSDFAAQAQGLGGLVHVYATFAANLFAISAGFTALSKAMDTVNLVKGLDQIGSASGRNLGSLAKQMVAVADGAISLRDAMTSTALASSGGMTNAAILRMTEVAKKASLALGRDLPDSMERLTKGIVKIQPELLDELGIMARVIPSQQNYAREIGKTIGALTDFEKRQAFANAVLAEGEKKFGAIALDANPYSKILASIQNLMQAGLELVNKVLGPVMSALAASPTGLTLALGGLAAVLLKQAIPALGMFRENAKRMEAETHARILRQVDEQSEAASQSDQIAAAAAEKKFRTEATTLQEISKLHKRFNREIVDAAGGKGTRELLRKSPFDLTPEDIDRIKSTHAKLSAETATIEQKTQALNIRHRLEGIERLHQKMTDIGDAAAEANEKADSKWYSHQEQKAKILEKLNGIAARRTILTNAADNAAIMGPVFAFSRMREEIAAMDASKFSKVMTTIKGSASIATSAVSTALSAFSVWGQVIALVISGIAILDNVLSNSAKEAKAYEGAIETLNSSFANIDRTLDTISKKDLSEFLGVESIQAKATALNDLSTNLNDIVLKFIKLKEAQNGWDASFDWLWDKVGKGSGDKLALGISTSVVDAMRALEEGPAKEAARKAIQNIIGDTPVTFRSIKEFNQVIKDLDTGDLINKGKAIADALATASRNANNGASALTGFKNALTEVGKQSSVISNSLMPTDDISKMGIALTTSASTLSEALKDPINGLIALKELAGDTRTLSFIDPKVAENLAGAKVQIDAITRSISEAKKQQQSSQAEIDKASLVIKQREDTLRKAGRSVDEQTLAGDPVAVKIARDTLKIEQEKLNLANIRLAAEEQNAKKIREEFSKTAQLLAAEGYKQLAMGLTKAINEAAVTSAKGYLDIIKSAGGNTAAMDAELSKRQIAIQIQDIQMKYANTLALTKLTLTIQKNTLVNEQMMLEEKIAKAEDSKNYSEVRRLGDKLSTITKSIREIDLASSIAGSGSKTVRAYAMESSKQNATPELVAAMGRMPEVILQSFGKDSAIAKLAAELGNAELQRQAGELTDRSNRANKAIDIDLKNINTEQSDITSLQNVSNVYSRILQDRKDALNIAEIENKVQKELNTLFTQYDIANIALNNTKLSISARNEAILVSERTLSDISALNASKEAQLDSVRQKSIKDRLIGEESLRKIEADRLNKAFQSYMDLELARISQRDSEISYMRDIGLLEQADATIAQAELAIMSQQISYAKELAEETRKYNDDRIAAENALKAIQEYNKDKRPDRQLDEGPALAALKEVNDGYSLTQLKLNTINETKKTSIKLTAEHKAMIEKQNEAMNTMVSIAESLTTAFGDVGTTIGDIGKALLKSLQSAEEFAKKEKALRDLGPVDEDGKAYKKLQADKTKAELSSIGAIAGASKKLFAEKTVAYKALNALEKGMAIARLAMQARELAVELGLITVKTASGAAGVAATAAEEGASLAALPTKIAGGVAKFFEQSGWLGFAGAAAFLALMASLGSRSGGNATPPGGFSSEDRQQSQGTGKSWVDGKLVENGGGTFGDSSAKSESIKNSLEIIKDTAVEGLSFSNRMLDTLISIDRGVNESAKSLYSVSGLRTGSSFGTEEGKTVDSGFIGIGGSSTETTIKDSGIALKGTFLDLTKAGKNAISTFENVAVHTTEQGFWGLGGSDETSFKTNVGSLETKVQKQIASIFSHGRELFQQVGETLHMSIEGIDSVLSGININEIASLRGLKGQELEKEMSSVIGNILDTAASTLFKKFEKFREFGEGMTETAIRVVDGSKKLHLAFTSIGMTLNEVTESTSSVTQDMLDRVTAAEKELKDAKDAASVLHLETRAGREVATGGGIDDPKVTEWITELKPAATAIEKLTLAEKELASAREAVLEATTTSTVNNYDITEALIKGAGGLSKFLDQVSSFKENFISEADQIKPVQQAVTAELKNITTALFGVSDVTIDSKESFKKLVLGLDLTSESSRVAYQKLMNVQEAFITVTNYWDKLTESFSDKFLNATEKLPAAQKALAVEMDQIAKTLGVTSLAAIDTKGEFKNLIMSLDRTTASGETAYRSLLSVQESFLNTVQLLDEVAKAAQETALGISENLSLAEASANKIVDNAFDAVKTEISKQRKVAQDAYNDRIKALDFEAKSIKDIYDAAVENLNRFKNQASETKKALEEALKTEREQADKIYKEASKALKDESKAAVKAYEATSTSLDSSIDALKASVEKLKSLDSLLDGAMNFFKSQDKSIESRIAAQDQLNAALIQAQAGNFPTAESLADAIAGVTQPSEQFFSSFVDYQRDLYRTSNTISKLSGLTKVQLSTEEQSLNALIDTKSLMEKNHEAHMKKLDEQLEALDAARDLQQEAFDARQKEIDDNYNSATKMADAELERLAEKYKADTKRIDQDKENAKLDLSKVEGALDEQLARATEAYNNIKGIRDNTSSIEQLIRDLISAGPKLTQATAAVTQDKLTRGNVVPYDEIEKFKQSIVGLTNAQQAAEIYLFALRHQMTTEQLAGIIGNKTSDISAYVTEKGLVDLNSAIDTKGKYDEAIVAGGGLLANANDTAAADMAAQNKKIEEKLKEDKIIKDYVGAIVAQVQSGAMSIEAGFRQVSATARGLNVTSTRIEEALGLEKGSIMGWINNFNNDTSKGPVDPIPAFAEGGDHDGGIRLVGEKGPEIEMTGPSRIISNKQTSDILAESTKLSNDEVLKELQKLRKAFELVVVNTSRSSKIADRWDTDGLPETRTAT